MDSLYSLPDWFLWLITVLALIISCALYFKERHNRFITLVDKIPGPKNVTFLETVLTYAVIPKEGNSCYVIIVICQ